MVRFYWLTGLALAVVLTVSGCGRKSTAETMQMAMEAAENGNWVEAMKYAGVVTERDPGDSAAWALKTIAAERAGQPRVALENARRGAELCPDSYAVQYTYGRLLAAQPGREADAQACLRRAFNLNRNDGKSLALALQCAARLNRPEARAYYDILEHLDPAMAAMPEIQSSVGIYSLLSGDLHGGLTRLIEAFKAAPDNPTVVLNLARALDVYIREPNKATPYYQKYLELASRNPEVSGTRTEVEARVRELTRRNR